MIVWINGPFGVGKTTLAAGLEARLRGRVFDPEKVGFLLRSIIKEPIEDFQHWPAWRKLVIDTAEALDRHDGRPVIAPMSLLRRKYATEILGSLTRRGVEQKLILLHADRRVIEDRARRDEVEHGAVEWRIAHIDTYEQALPWLTEMFTAVDTTSLSPADVLAAVEAQVVDSTSSVGPA